MNNEVVIKHLIDIKERLSSVEANTDDLKKDMKESRLDQRELTSRVTALERDVSKAQGSILGIKWIIGLTLSLPAVVYAVARLIAA